MEEKRKKYPIVNTPTILQMEAVECGAASIGMILGYFKKFVPLSELRDSCGVSRDGSKASNMVKAAEYYGLEVEAYMEQPESLRYMKPPMILHWNFNHFVVLEGIKGDKVYINDPSNGKNVIKFEEFDKAFTGVVLTFKEGKNFQPSGKKDSVYNSIIERLNNIKSSLFYTFILGLLIIIPGLMVPAISQLFIDNVVVNSDKRWVVPLILSFLFAGSLQGFIYWLKLKYFSRLKEKISVVNSSVFFWNMLRLPTKFFYQRYAGDLSSRLGINDYIADILSDGFSKAAVNVFVVIFYFMLMMQYSATLTLISVSISIIHLLISRYIAKIRVINDKRAIHENAKLMNTSILGIRLIESIKAGGGENGFFNKWSGHHAKMINYNQEIGKINMFISAIPYTLQQLNAVLILSFGSYLVLKGKLTLGMLVAFQALIGNFTGPIDYLISFFTTLPRLKGKFDRLDDVLYSKQDPMLSVGKESIKAEDIVKLKGEIEIKNLKFGYSKMDGPSIEGFNLKLTPGSRVALVGPSGSGKSTVVRIISGLYKEWEGDILFEGKKREDLNRSVLKNSIGVVDQSIVSFNASVLENIRLWDKSIENSDIYSSAKDSLIHKAILHKTEGYDYKIGENSNGFSGGEMQRIEIARVLSLNPSILIMDEATSALDAQTEKDIDDNIRKRGCTTIIVAHRLSTIRDADEIIVLDKGKIVERGRHEELLKNNGLYKKLITSV